MNCCHENIGCHGEVKQPTYNEWIFNIAALSFGYLELCCFLIYVLPPAWWGMIGVFNLGLIALFGYDYFKSAGTDIIELSFYVLAILSVYTIPMMYQMGGLWFVMVPFTLCLAFDGFYQIWQKEKWSMHVLISLTVAMAWLFSTVQLMVPGLTAAFGLQLYYQDSLIILGINGIAKNIKKRFGKSHDGLFSRRFTDEIASVSIKGMISVAVLSSVLWLLFGPQAVALSYAIQSFMGVLMAVCPCVLGVVTPICEGIASEFLTKTTIRLSEFDIMSKTSRVVHVYVEDREAFQKTKLFASLSLFQVKYNSDEKDIEEEDCVIGARKSKGKVFYSNTSRTNIQLHMIQILKIFIKSSLQPKHFLNHS